ncbi:MAG: hypothetical protein WBB52_04665 [Acidimicrobiales bacterium]
MNTLGIHSLVFAGDTDLDSSTFDIFGPGEAGRTIGIPTASTTRGVRADDRSA